MSSAFIQAAVILLREGLEAMLVIAALAGYLTKAGAGHRIQALYGGALAAVGASIIAAWLFAVLNSGEHSDVLEGVIILVAAALMLYVSGWLMVKQDPRGWQEYLAQKADHALSQDTVWAVGALAKHRKEGERAAIQRLNAMGCTAFRQITCQRGDHEHGFKPLAEQNDGGLDEC